MRDVTERVLLDDEEVVTYGSPCYVVVDDGKGVDSDYILYGKIERDYGKPVVKLMYQSSSEYLLSPTDRAKVLAAHCLVLVDEVNITGHKLWAVQLPLALQAAHKYERPLLAKIAYSTAAAEPTDNQYYGNLIDNHHELMSKWFRGLIVRQDGNMLSTSSPGKPGVFSSKNFGDRACEALTLCVTIGRQLSTEGPLGYGEMGVAMLFEHFVPDNTLPVITHGGKVSLDDCQVDWRPLLRQVA